MSKVKVIVIRPGDKYGEEMTVSNNIKSFQKIVDGYVGMVKLDKNFALLYNEMGRLRNLKPSITIMGKEYVGNVIIIGVKEEEFVNVPLSFEEWKEFVKCNSEN